MKHKQIVSLILSTALALTALFTGCAREEQPKQEKKVENSFIYDDLAEKMKQALGTKVKVLAKGNGKGKIEIEYYSMEELERLMDLFKHLKG